MLTMPRTFLCLVAGNLIVLVGAAVLGLSAPAWGAERHVALAVFSLLVSCLVQVVTFTYFSVSGKMLAQALHLGRLELSPLIEVQALKKSAMRCVAAVAIAVVLATATGAAHWRGERGSHWHLAAAGFALAVHFGAWYRQFLLISRHAALVSEALVAYQRVRQSTRSGTAAASVRTPSAAP